MGGKWEAVTPKSRRRELRKIEVVQMRVSDTESTEKSKRSRMARATATMTSNREGRRWEILKALSIGTLPGRN